MTAKIETVIKTRTINVITAGLYHDDVLIAFAVWLRLADFAARYEKIVRLSEVAAISGSIGFSREKRVLLIGPTDLPSLLAHARDEGQVISS